MRGDGEIPLAQFAHEVRSCYPELQTPTAWRAAYHQWRAELDDPGQAELDVIFAMLWEKGGFSRMVPATEELAWAAGPHFQRRLSVEMDIDQSW